MIGCFGRGRRTHADLLFLRQLAQNFTAFAFVYNHRRTPGKRQQIFVITHQMRFVLRIFSQFACTRSVLSFLHGFLLLSARIPFRTKSERISLKAHYIPENLFLFLLRINLSLGISFFATLRGGVVPRNVKNVYLCDESITCPRSSSIM